MLRIVVEYSGTSVCLEEHSGGNGISGRILGTVCPQGEFGGWGLSNPDSPKVVRLVGSLGGQWGTAGNMWLGVVREMKGCW